MVLSAQKTVEVPKVVVHRHIRCCSTTGAHGCDRAETRADSTGSVLG